MNKNVFVVVDFDGEMHPYIAEDLTDALIDHENRTGDLNVAGAFLYGNEFVKVVEE